MKRPAHIHRRLIAHLFHRSGKKSVVDFSEKSRADFLSIHPHIGLRCWKLVQYILGKRKRPY
jgi:hypothetical protein